MRNLYGNYIQPVLLTVLLGSSGLIVTTLLLQLWGVL